MHKEIKYGGFTAQPSDYECQDGDLAVSLNLINEDGSIKVLPKPAEILTLQENESILFIHKATGSINYIIHREVGVFWLTKDDDTDQTDDAQLLISSSKTICGVEAIGNTLVFAYEDGLKYAIWRNGSYKVLGEKPPFVSIDFGMCKVGTLTDTDNYKFPDTCINQSRAGGGASAPHSSATHPTKEDLKEVTQMVYGLLNPAIADDITSKGLFYQPFFVRYAFRLYDGSHYWHSSPILMLPSVLPPLVHCTFPANSTNYNTTLTLDVDYFALAYRILSDSQSQLTDWEDIISGIDIFISAPVYTYDQSKDLTSATAYRYELVRSIYDYSWSNGLRGRYNNTSVDEQTPSEVFIGHYAENDTSRYVDHTLPTAEDRSITLINIRPHEKFHNNIRSSQIFYKIAEIKLKDIEAMSDLKRLKLLNHDLSTLVTLETLKDDFESHCKLIPSSLYGFNSRLNLAGIKWEPAKPLPVRSMMQFGNPNDTANYVQVMIWTRKNGVLCEKVGDLESDAEYKLFNYTTNFPRYIFYPDASAFRMAFLVHDSSNGSTGLRVFVIDLIPHDFLNGAYYYNDDFGKILPHEPLSALPAYGEVSQFVDLNSKIYTSEVNNPFVFPVTGINTVGNGEVKSICSAAKALSQGQFGQFPLYAFTDEGVWALEVSSTGSYTARQPITRDVCINPHGITQIDSAVLFPTDRGIMLLSGSNTTCISEAINNDYPFHIFDLPGMAKLHSMIGHTSDSCLTLQPFTDFIKCCRMIYDYVHQRIIVYNKSYTYAYVFSLKTKLWGMMYSKICDNVNSYPEALAVTTDGKMVNFAKTDGEEVKVKGLLVTRPLKLDAADVLKTVDTIIQRGNFQKGHVQSVVYGSRDLAHWALVWTSKDHFLRGFRGTPYKYYRIALLCGLSEDESVYGATIQYQERKTNQPR